MNAAIQKFETVAFLRGGRLAGFLDRERTPFYLTKTLREVAHIDEQGRAVRVPQWIIDLEAPVDVTALLRDGEDAETAMVQAQLASQLLQGEASATRRDLSPDAHESPLALTEQALPEADPLRDACPTLEQLMARAQAYGIVPEHYQAYTDRRWGRGWKLNPHGRARAWDELERYQNDPQGYRDKIETELQRASSGRPA
jgi:hypothetical protein